MTKILNYIVLVTFITQFLFNTTAIADGSLDSAKASFRKKLNDKFQYVKTIGSFLDRIERDLDKDTMAFLRRKTSGAETTAIRITEKRPFEYMIESNGLIVQMKIETRSTDQPTLWINNKNIVYSSTPETFWNNIVAKLPQRTSVMWDYLAPQASASPVALGGAAIALVAVSFGGFSVHKVFMCAHEGLQCAAHGLQSNDCSKLNREQLSASIRQFERTKAWSDCDACVQIKQKLQDCLQAKISGLPYPENGRR